jgi:hypothetical protein
VTSKARAKRSRGMQTELANRDKSSEGRRKLEENDGEMR